jgi:glycosyltransferase involved in cell wall biosynthesis
VIGFELAEQPMLLSLFRQLDLEDAVICEGELSSERLAPFYRAAGVLLVPSVYEGLPLVILEALRSGLPCVATRVSGHPEVIEDGENGYLVAADDPEGMALRCISILKNPGRRALMAHHARVTYRERHSLNRFVDQHLDVYRQVARI